MKSLLILGAGILQVAVIKKAKEKGIYTVVADGNPAAIGLPLADKSLVVNIVDPEAVLKALENEHIDGVIHPCSEVAMNTMGIVNDVFHLSGIGVKTAVLATNKEKMREAFRLGNAPSPLSFGAGTFGEFLQKLYRIEGKAIVKPSRNSGSRGVSCINRQQDRAFLEKAFDTAFMNSRDKAVVVEQYIEGPEFSVEIIIWNNEINVLTVTDKLTTGAPHFVELGHSQPSKFSPVEVELVVKAAISGCKALHLTNCVAHAEVKLQQGKPYIMEIGARLGGDFISTELVHLSTGIDMVGAAIQVALGEEPDLTPKHAPQGVAIRYFTPRPGVLKSIDFSKCHIDSSVYQLEVYKKPGDIISEVTSSLDRSGHVITIGKNVEDAVAYADNIISSIGYVMQ